MADWLTLAVVHLLVGFEVDTLGFIGYSGGGEDTEALLIIAFLLYLLVAILIMMTKLADLNHNFIVNIIILVAIGTAAAFLIIGVGLEGDRIDRVPYPATLELSAAFLGILGGVFLLLNMLCGGGSKTNPS